MAKKIDQTEEKIIAVEEALSKTEKFIERNQKILLYVLIGIIAIVLAYFAYMRMYLAPREEKAQNQMFMAEKYFEKDSLNFAINGDGNYPGFKKIIDDYSGTKSANLARYYLGICYLKKGQFQDAILQLKKFNSKDNIVGPLAKGAIADAYIELKDYDKAVDYYLDAAEKNENTFTTPMFLMKAGLTYEFMNKYDKALDVYQRIKNEYRQSNEGREIEKYIASAEAKFKK